jgi:hypothetical protein
VLADGETKVDASEKVVSWLAGTFRHDVYTVRSGGWNLEEKCEKLGNERAKD